MLRIHTSTSAASAKSYFSSADYYSEGQELVGIWHGEAAKRLGLTGEVKKQDWDRMCDNRDPATGKPLTVRRKDNRRIGFDCTFDVPKSVSVLYGLTGDERILDAFRSAVDETMLDIEREAKARVRKGGMNEDRTTGNLAWGQYVHFTSRPVDGIPCPQLHSHCFVQNISWDDRESRFKALQFGDVKRDAPYFQALADARLARKLGDLGLSIQRTHKGWEIAGLDKSTLDKFSRRTAEIEELARRRGITDPKEKAQLGAKTRGAKAKELSMPELRREWRSRLNSDEAVALRSIEVQVGSEPIKTNELVMKESVQRAVDHVFERSAVLPERMLVAEALRQAVGTAEPEKIVEELQKRELIYRERDGRMYVTDWSVLKEEESMLDFARSGRGSCRPLGPSGYVPKRDWLSDEQKAAVKHILSSSDRIILLRGGAGTGKTTLMQETIDGIKAGGKDVFTFAPSAAASHGVLCDEAGFEGATTVARLLMDQSLQNKARGQVLWVDEAALMGSRETKQVFDLAKRLEARIVMSGDSRQHSSVSRGGVLKLLETEAGLVPAELKHIRRQSGEYKRAVEAISEGRISEGFTRLDDLKWIHEIEGVDRDKAVAAAYLDSIRKPGATLVICPTHLEGNRVSDRVREELKHAGKIGAIDREFTILRPVSLTEAQRRDPASLLPGDVAVFHQNARGHTKGSRLIVGKDHVPFDQAARFTVYRPGCIRLAAGDRVRITKSSRGDNLNNGDLRTIERFTPKGEVVLDSGAVLPPDFGHIDLGYVITSHSAQGKSVDRAILVQPSASFAASNMQQFYVSVSRAKKELRIFTDDKSSLLEAVSRCDERMTATELLKGHTAGRDHRGHHENSRWHRRANGDERPHDYPHRAPQRDLAELTHEP